MVPLDPWTVLHPATYHDGGVAFLPIAVLVIGVALIAFGAWQLYGAAPRSRADGGEDSTDAPAER
ncbi:hypothetical protein BRC81_15910 [Halobacteriales archaeon QS_1_68_20]|nr:MAG: hypothetical protein BRC81_15910 [Halobacteriales archaeon QS_1_68_20]